MSRNLVSAVRAAAACALLAATAVAQQPDPRKLPVVYRLPGMDAVQVQRDITYKTAAGVALKLDAYAPAGAKAGDRLPTVIYVNGVGAPDLKDWVVYRNWAQLTAVSGMLAITYQARGPEAAKDTEDLVAYVRANAAALKADENRICIWSCSANVRVGLPFVMQEDRKYIRCAVFYYGVTPPTTVRDDVPMLVARAGLDSPTLNQGIDAFVAAAVPRDVPMVFYNYADGQHAFDIFDDTETSRDIVRQTLEFMKANLTRPPQVAVLTPGRFVRVITGQGWEAALRLYDETKRTNPGHVLLREQSLNAVGYQLLQASKTKEAVEVFKLNVEAYPASANVYDSLADGYLANGDRALALRNTEIALEKLATSPNMSEAAKAGLRASAEEKLKRLKTP